MSDGQPGDDGMTEEDLERAVGGVVSTLKKLAPFVVVGLLLVGGVTFTVDEGERTVVTRFGERVDVADEGLHFKIPFVDRTTTYSIRKRSTTMTGTQGEGQRAAPDSISAPDQDGVQVTFDTTVRWRIQEDRVGYVYDEVSKDQRTLAREFVRSDIRRAYRICTQRRTAIEIYTGGMEDMERCVHDEISSRFAPNGLEVTAVNQRDVSLPGEVEERINEKRSLDEQLVIEEKQIAIREKQAEQRVAEARGIRESQAIIDQTLTRDYLRYLWIQEGLEKGDAIYVPVGDDGLPIYKDVDSERGPEANATLDVGNSTAPFTRPDNRTATAE